MRRHLVASCLTVSAHLKSHFSATFAVVYHPVLSAVTDQFFGEFSDSLERIAVNTMPVFGVSDLNIHLDTADDAAMLKLSDILITYSRM